MREMFLKIPRWLVTVAVLAAVLVLTLAPISLSGSAVSRIPYGDKIVHFVMFGGLAGVALFDLSRPWGSVTRRMMIVAAVAATAVGGLIEIVQGTELIGRGREFWDLVADAAGAVTGVVVVKILADRYLQSGESR